MQDRPEPQPSGGGRSLLSGRLATLLDGERLTWAAGLCIAVIQGFLLVRAYRIAPDDAMFYGVALRGLDAAWAETLNTAMHQGRVGAFVIIPINIAATFLSDHVAFRWLCVALNFAVFLLFSLWAARVLAANCSAAIFLGLVALTVTDYFHFSPVSFPLQNTLPFLAILAGRLLLVRPVPPARPALPMSVSVPGMVLFILGMIATEYGFMLGTGLLAFEMMRHRLAAESQVAPRPRVVIRRFAGDLAACALVLMIYFAWRFFYPSSYDGNQLASLMRLPYAIATGLAHMVMPLALPYATLLRPIPFPGAAWAFAALVPGVIAALGLFAARRELPALARPLTVAVTAVACALYVVFPVSMTLKQQERCFERYGCAFLDSQMAYLFMVAACVAIAAWILALTAQHRRDRVAAALSVAFGIAAAFTFYDNKRLTDDMRRISDVWDNAQMRVCEGEPTPPLAALFDPGGTTAMHEDVDREAFWTLFRDRFRPGCAAAQ